MLSLNKIKKLSLLEYMKIVSLFIISILSILYLYSLIAVREKFSSKVPKNSTKNRALNETVFYFCTWFYDLPDIFSQLSVLSTPLSLLILIALCFWEKQKYFGRYSLIGILPLQGIFFKKEQTILYYGFCYFVL